MKKSISLVLILPSILIFAFVTPKGFSYQKVEGTPFEMKLPSDSKIHTNAWGDAKINGGSDFGITISEQQGNLDEKMQRFLSNNESLMGDQVTYLFKKKDGYVAKYERDGENDYFILHLIESDTAIWVFENWGLIHTESAIKRMYNSARSARFLK